MTSVSFKKLEKEEVFSVTLLFPMQKIVSSDTRVQDTQPLIHVIRTNFFNDINNHA